MSLDIRETEDKVSQGEHSSEVLMEMETQCICGFEAAAAREPWAAFSDGHY